MRGSDYAELRAFAAIVEHGSFARAANHLRVSPSALSQTIRELETRLGMRLLNRTTRSVAPSEAGARLLARLTPALADLEAAIEEMQALRDQPSGLLRINSTRLAVVDHLAPLVGPFLNAFPDITLDLVIEDRLVDIVAARFDAGIRLGEKVEKDMIAVRIGGDLQLICVASPTYIERHGKPKTPRELQAHRCINSRWPTDGSLYRWEFERGEEKLEAAVHGPLIANEPDLVLAACVAGVGIAYAFEHRVREEIAAGRLVHLLKDWTPPFPGFYLYYPGRRQMPPALRAFIDFVTHQAAA